MITLSKNDLYLIRCVLEEGARKAKEERDNALTSGAARMYGLIYERYESLAKKMQKAQESNAKRIAID